MKDSVKLRRAAKERDRRVLMQTKGLCTCGKPLKTKWQCEICIKSRDKEGRKEYNRARLLRLSAEGRCQCGQPRLEDNSRCQRCYELNCKYNKKISDEAKAWAIELAKIKAQR